MSMSDLELLQLVDTVKENNAALLVLLASVSKDRAI